MGILSFLGKFISFWLLGIFILLLSAAIFISTLPGTIEKIKQDVITDLPEQMDKVIGSEMPSFSIEELKLGCMYGSQSEEAIQKICPKVISGEITTEKQVRIEFYKSMLSSSVADIEKDIIPKANDIKKYGMYPLLGAIGIFIFVLFILRLCDGTFTRALQTMCSMFITLAIIGLIGILITKGSIPFMMGKYVDVASMGGGQIPVSSQKFIMDKITEWINLFIDPVLFTYLGILIASVIGWFVFKMASRKPRIPQTSQEDRGGRAITV